MKLGFLGRRICLTTDIGSGGDGVGNNKFEKLLLEVPLDSLEH